MKLIKNIFATVIIAAVIFTIVLVEAISFWKWILLAALVSLTAVIVWKVFDIENPFSESVESEENIA